MQISLLEICIAGFSSLTELNEFLEIFNTDSSASSWASFENLAMNENEKSFSANYGLLISVMNVPWLVLITTGICHQDASENCVTWLNNFVMKFRFSNSFSIRKILKLFAKKKSLDVTCCNKKLFNRNIFLIKIFKFCSWLLWTFRAVLLAEIPSSLLENWSGGTYLIYKFFDDEKFRAMNSLALWEAFLQDERLLKEQLKLCSVRRMNAALFTNCLRMNNSTAPSAKWNLLWIIQSPTYINIHKHKLSHG